MARLIKSVPIRTDTRARIGAAPDIGPAINNFGKTLGKLAFEKGAQERTDEANLAAQQLEFGRDSQGRLVSPEFPDKEGFFKPSIYEEQYELMVTNRYKQQVQIDYTGGLNAIANKHPRDPVAFGAAATAYRDSILEVALPEVAAEIQLDLDTKIVQYDNSISNELADFTFKQSQDTQLLTLQTSQRELGSMMMANASPEEFSTAKAQWKIDLLAGRALNLYNDAFVEQAEQDLEKYIFKTALTKQLDGLQNTREANAQAMVDIQSWITGDAEVEVPIGGVMQKVKVSDVLPSIEERQQAFLQPQQLIQGREQVRNILERATWDRQFKQFMLTDVAGMEDAIKHGTPFDEQQGESLARARDIAINSNDVNMFSFVMRLENANTANIEERGLQMRSDAFSELMTRTTEEMLKDNPELLQLTNSFMDDLIGMDVNEFLNPIDPTGLQSTQDQRHQELRRVMSFLSGSLSKGSDPAFMKEFHRQGRERQIQFKRLHAEWIALNGEPVGGDGQLAMLTDINARMPTWALEQTQNMALLMNDVVSGYMGAPADLAFWTNVDRAKGIELIDQPIRRHGVIPASLSDFIVGTLSQTQSSKEDQAQALDFARQLWEIPSINSGKFHATAGLGQMGVTLRALFEGSPASMIQPGEFVDKALERGAKGESPFQTVGQLEADGININEILMEELNDRFTGFLDQVEFKDRRWYHFGVGNTAGVSGTPLQEVEVPLDMYNSIIRNVQPIIPNYSVTHSAGRKAALGESIAITIEDEGWVISERGYSPVRGEQPLLFRFGGFLQQGDPQGIGGREVHGIGQGLQRLAGFDKAWSRLGPEGMYDDDELVVVDRVTNQRLKEQFPGQRLRIKDNVTISLNEEATAINGVRTWQLWAKTGEGTDMLFDDFGLMTISFDDDIKSMRDRQEQETIRQSLINARVQNLSRNLNQRIDIPSVADQPDSPMAKEATRLIREIEQIRDAPINQLKQFMPPEPK